MTNHIRWGIIAPGAIAHTFANEFAGVRNATLEGVASRALSRAEAFAERFSIPKTFGSYRQLCEDPQIDAVYIATPHNLHYENTIMAMQNEKSVLCEKPFATDATQARTMRDMAREKGLFCMEAMWARFNPACRTIASYIRKGMLGDIVSVHADFGFIAPFGPDHRLYNPNLAGGALLDLGVYPVWFSHWLLGTPDALHSHAIMGSTGVDEQNAAVFEYTGRAHAVVSSGFRTDTDRTAVVAGTKGTVFFDRFWHRALKVTLCRREEEDVVVEFNENDPGLHNETQHATDCILQGKTESPDMTLDTSVAVMETMDRMRAQWGLRYPWEKQ